MKKLLLVLVVVILGGIIFYVTKNTTEEVQTPHTVVQEFYNEWIEQKGSALLDETYKNDDRLTSTLIQEIEGMRSSFENGGYDPILCAQDFPNSFSLDTASTDNNQSTAYVAMDFGGNIQTVTVGLILDSQTWKINSITCPIQNEITFEKTGNLTIYNTDMGERIWILVYEEPGRPALTTDLHFTSGSICARGQENNSCDTSVLQEGQRVKILGFEENGSITVVRLEHLE